MQRVICLPSFLYQVAINADDEFFLSLYLEVAVGKVITGCKCPASFCARFLRPPTILMNCGHVAVRTRALKYQIWSTACRETVKYRTLFSEPISYAINIVFQVLVQDSNIHLKGDFNFAFFNMSLSLELKKFLFRKSLF